MTFMHNKFDKNPFIAFRAVLVLDRNTPTGVNTLLPSTWFYQGQCDNHVDEHNECITATTTTCINSIPKSKQPLGMTVFIYHI